MIHIGSSYYPTHYNEADWEQDFALMAEYGHTAVRTGELITAWDALERQPQEVDFSSLDRFFELAGKNKLRVLLGTGACSPPHWLRVKHPDLSVVDRDGHSYPPGAMWSWACINHPAYLAEAKRYLDQLLERYGKRDELLGWQIHNEPGYPFVPRAGAKRADWYDYNPHTIAAFRKWLQEKYGTIDKLNEAWAWIPTCIGYTSFDEVDAPRRTPEEWGIPNAWMDWRRFCADNWNAFIRLQHEQIKARTPDLPTMTNVYGAGVDNDGRLGIDCWTLPQQVDAIGYDLYPGSRPGYSLTSRFPSWFLDFALSTALNSKRPLWLPELESGPIGGWADGPAHATSAADLRRWALMALARGSQMLLFQGFRAWERLPLHWGGLLDWNGEKTPGLDVPQELAGFCQQHQELLEQARPQRARVRILHSQDSQVFGANTGWPGNMQTIYEPLAQLGYALEFVHAGADLAELDCELLLLPSMLMLEEAAIEQLTAYVEGGGRILTFPRTGMLDDSCQLRQQRSGGLSTLLGVKPMETKHLTGHSIVMDFGSEQDEIELEHRRMQFQVLELDDAHALANTSTGQPLLTLVPRGKGQAVHCALSIDQGGVANPTEVWAKIMEVLDTPPDFSDASDPTLGCEPKLLEIDADTALLFIAELSGAEEHAIQLRGRQPQQAEMLWERGKVEIADGELRVKLPAGEATVCKLSWAKDA